MGSHLLAEANPEEVAAQRWLLKKAELFTAEHKVPLSSTSIVTIEIYLENLYFSMCMTCLKIKYSSILEGTPGTAELESSLASSKRLHLFVLRNRIHCPRLLLLFVLKRLLEVLISCLFVSFLIDVRLFKSKIVLREQL